MTEVRNETAHIIRRVLTEISDIKFGILENYNFDIVSYFVFRASDLS